MCPDSSIAILQQEMNRQISVLQKQVDQAEKEVREEKMDHDATRDELAALQSQLRVCNGNVYK